MKNWNIIKKETILYSVSMSKPMFLLYTYKCIYIGESPTIEIGDGFGGSDVPFAAAGGSGSGSGSGRGSVFTVGSGIGEPGSFFGIWAKKLDNIKFRRGQKNEREKLEIYMLH